MSKREEAEMCAIHDEMQKRLDERWKMHIESMETNFREVKFSLCEVANRLRAVEIRFWMFAGAITILLFLIEKWPSVSSVLKGH